MLQKLGTTQSTLSTYTKDEMLKRLFTIKRCPSILFVISLKPHKYANQTYLAVPQGANGNPVLSQVLKEVTIKVMQNYHKLVKDW